MGGRFTITPGLFLSFLEIFSHFADYIAWKLLKMALEVKYMME